MGKFIDITGQRFGRLVAIDVVCKGNRRGNRTTFWRFQCDCGNEHVANGGQVRRGMSGSCGCLQRELASVRARTHGLSKTPEHKAWSQMKTRCNNPNRVQYRDWGGRGIKICERWKNFENFLADMGPMPEPGYSLDRIDNDCGYEPGNCRWATQIQQVRNTRQNRVVDYQGERMCLSEAAERAGLAYWTVHSRLRNGWSVERALTEPVKKRSAA